MPPALGILQSGLGRVQDGAVNLSPCSYWHLIPLWAGEGLHRAALLKYAARFISDMPLGKFGFKSWFMTLTLKRWAVVCDCALVNT